MKKFLTPVVAAFRSRRSAFSAPVLFAGVILGLSCVPLRAVEPWANPNLTVTNGLALWLDAAQENAARPGRMPLLSTAGPMDLWHDASGNGRHVRQAASAARPKFLGNGATPLVWFDGKDDFLNNPGASLDLKLATVFVRARVRTNSGGYRGFLSLNQTGINDYRSGLNLDLGSFPSAGWDALNVEGAGSVGGKNLLTKPVSGNGLHVLTLVSTPGPAGVQLWLDGVPQGKRERGADLLHGDELTVGARLFSNAAEPPYAQGFLEGEIAEVLIYNRVLDEKERRQVETYLSGKVTASERPGRTLEALEPVANPAAVQMFVPGFTARTLPLKLPNLNNVKYRPDGKVFALGYNGQVWLLSDTNGDGLEDKATFFWQTNTITQPIGMALTPPGYVHGDGVFIASRGKVVLLTDTNRDDVADREIIVAEKWQDADFPHGVDALGVAVAKDGSVYFGIGTANFAGAYRVDGKGVSQYQKQGDRGTICKVSPDFSKREILCTGIRFPVAMAFNELGDLFCSDQEGATWLPNGNPLDELLHIEPGRHYGFPPRHPKHLPDVLDEPSVFDYGPQHQSVCGVNFNLTPGGKGFGPDWWKGDAIVSGYSRGKLWRTKLVKTAAGYVAQNQLIATLNQLVVDACPTPTGDLLVATHSGQPDWGSGPTGEGTLLKISYTDKAVPQPVRLWAASPTETAVEFDRALDPAQLAELTKKIRLVTGRYVAAGDRFETLRPGYQVVQNQMIEPRYRLEISSVALEADGRTLLIRTLPRTEAVAYAVTLPDVSGKSGAETDLAHGLNGVQATWTSADGKQMWSDCLPHLDTAVNTAFLSGSALPATLAPLLKQPGRLVLKTQLDCDHMLRAITQPGAKLDYQYSNETVTVIFKASAAFDLLAPQAKVERISDREVRLTTMVSSNAWFALQLTLPTGGKITPALETSWFTTEDARPRALPLRRFFLPWAQPAGAVTDEAGERTVPELAGGNRLRGEKLFQSDTVGCFKCHVVNGLGGHVGPDLSNLTHRDYASVLKDILQPSAAINPDHVAYTLTLRDGESVTGLLSGGDAQAVSITDVSGKTQKIPRTNIASQKSSALSLMPEGLLEALSAAERKDLLTYLLLPPPLTPAPLEISGEPPARTRAEVSATLRHLNPPSTAPATNALKIVLCSGPKDHGPGEHDYPLWQKRWSRLLALADNVTVETAEAWPTSSQWSTADSIIFYSNNPQWTADKGAVLDHYLARGGGLMFIHYAVDGHAAPEALAQRIGLAWQGGKSAFRHGALDLKFAPHPLTDGLPTLSFVDESYWQLLGDGQPIQMVAFGVENGQPRPLLWTREPGRGRIFVSIPGHYTWTFDDPLFRLLLLRGLAWTAHTSEDRFHELITVGARMKE